MIDAFEKIDVDFKGVEEAIHVSLSDEDLDMIVNFLHSNNIEFKWKPDNFYKDERDYIFNEYTEFCDYKYDKPCVRPDAKILNEFLINELELADYWKLHEAEFRGYDTDSDYFDESTWIAANKIVPKCNSFRIVRSNKHGVLGKPEVLALRRTCWWLVDCTDLKYDDGVKKWIWIRQYMRRHEIIFEGTSEECLIELNKISEGNMV